MYLRTGTQGLLWGPGESPSSAELLVPPPGIQIGIVQIITTRVIPRRGATQSGVGWTVGMNLTGVARKQ